MFIFLPIKLKTSFIKSLKPWREQDLIIQVNTWYICCNHGVNGYLSVWLCKVTLICQIQRGSVLSSVILQNNLIHTRILLGNLTRESRNVRFSRETTPNKEYDLYSSEKASFYLLLWVLQKTHIWHKSKKANKQMNKHQLKKKKKAFSGRTVKPEMAVGPRWQ